MRPGLSLHDCSDCYRLERKLPGGSVSHWVIAPFRGARWNWAILLRCGAMMRYSNRRHRARRRPKIARQYYASRSHWAAVSG